MQNEIIVKPKLSFKLYIFIFALPIACFFAILCILALYVIITPKYYLESPAELSSVFVGLPIVFLISLLLSFPVISAFPILKHRITMRINSFGIRSYCTPNNSIFIPWHIIEKIQIIFPHGNWKSVYYCTYSFLEITLKENIDIEYRTSLQISNNKVLIYCTIYYPCYSKSGIYKSLGSNLDIDDIYTEIKTIFSSEIIKNEINIS